MFADIERAGPFAIDRERLIAGEPETLFRLLVSVVMFQKRRDTVVLGIQRRIPPRLAAEMLSARTLLQLVDRSCRWMRTATSLRDDCDLAKNKLAEPICSLNPTKSCHLKRHTAVLKRYGDFGKYPTSAALVLREAGANDLAHHRATVLQRLRSKEERALALEEFVTRIHRVSRKLANMFLALVTNPDLTPSAPWERGIEWTRFIVIDSNVDLFLSSIGYRGGSTYDARCNFLRRLAAEIDLSKLDERLQGFNPRIVQQAMYVFMSTSNRLKAPNDCARGGRRNCTRCPLSLKSRCPVAFAGA